MDVKRLRKCARRTYMKIRALLMLRDVQVEHKTMEDAETVTAFFEDMKMRGLNDPLSRSNYWQKSQ
jgi:hypothetical protein